MHKAIGLFLALAAAFAQDHMTNESIIKMVQAKVSEPVILKAIEQHPAQYVLTPDGIISLKDAGVPDAVISAMQARVAAPKSEGSASRSASASLPTRQSRQRGWCRSIEVARFDVAPGIEFPGDHVSALMGDVIAQLSHSHKFEAVLAQGQQGTGQPPPCIQLAGTVTKYKKGSRALRYLGGPVALAGPGKTVVKARVKFLDKATGELLHEADVDGKVWIGKFGGDSSGADRGLGKEVAKVAAKALF